MRIGGVQPPEDLGLLLPFPPKRSLKGAGSLQVSPRTARIFFDLLKARRLPSWAMGDLIRHCQTWKR